MFKEILIIAKTTTIITTTTTTTTLSVTIKITVLKQDKVIY